MSTQNLLLSVLVLICGNMLATNVTQLERSQLLDAVGVISSFCYDSCLLNQKQKSSVSKVFLINIKLFCIKIIQIQNTQTKV